MHSPSDLLQELLEAIAKTLVDHPEKVQVRAVQGQVVTILELRVHPEDELASEQRIAAVERSVEEAARFSHIREST